MTNVKFKAYFQIQNKVTSCNGSPHIFCTCGVAVRSAADVFMIDRCPDRKPWYFGFPSCIENTLEVTRKQGNEWIYLVNEYKYLFKINSIIFTIF